MNTAKMTIYAQYDWKELIAVGLFVAIASNLLSVALAYPGHETIVRPSVATSPGRQSVDASLDYLRTVMDQFHDRFPVYDDVSSAGNHFHAFGKIPSDTAALLVNGSYTNNPHSGATAIRFELRNTPNPNFGGFYQLNGVLPPGETRPQLNFGTVPNAGINLSGATALVFWARGERGGEKVDFFMGGVGRNPVNGSPEQPYPDSTPVVKILVTLSTQWQQFRIDLNGMDLSYVLGGFGWVASLRGNPDTTRNNPDGVIFYVDDIQYELSAARRDQRLNEPRFLSSFTTLPLQPDPFDSNTGDDIDLVLRNTAFTYDNALAVLAFLADGSTDSLRRARLIGDAFVYASQHDRTFNDNLICSDAPLDPLGINGARIRTAYAAGDISLPPGWTPNGRVGTVPSPGFYYEATQTFYEVEQGAIDIGNNAWAMIALLALHRRTQQPNYRDEACKLGNFIRASRNSTGPYQGFLGGVNDPESATPSRRPWASSEHNLDVHAAFTAMFEITRDPSWQADALHARDFVEAMWDQDRGCYLAGTLDSEHRNMLLNQLPVDVQAWSVLSLPDTLLLHPGLLDSVEQNHRTIHHGFTGFDFNEDRDGVWFEGTAHVSLAYTAARQPTATRNLRAELLRAQQTTPFGDGRGIAAACHDGISTGFGFALFRRLHLGATVWHIFSQLGFNPYYQTLGDTDGDSAPDAVELSEGTDPNVKDNDVFNSARLFSLQQYRDFLGREGDPGGVTFWTNLINSGSLARAQVIDSFFNSPEFQGSVSPVTRLYFAYFLRIPDYGGLLFWVSQYRNGASLDSISQAFAQSPEFIARYGSLSNADFVTLLYNNVLGRQPDPGGLAFWVGQLNSGAMTRGQVMLGFSESPEYKQTSFNKVYVTMIYVGMLRRAPEQGGFDFWVNQLNGGASGLNLIQGFLTVPEYHSRFLP